MNQGHGRVSSAPVSRPGYDALVLDALTGHQGFVDRYCGDQVLLRPVNGKPSACGEGCHTWNTVPSALTVLRPAPPVEHLPAPNAATGHRS
jgi:hypothetical protein